MKTILIICGSATGTIALIFLIFFIKLKFQNNKSAYRHKLNDMYYEDENPDDYPSAARKLYERKMK